MTETLVGGILGGLSVNHAYNSSLQLETLSATGIGTYSVSLGYDTAGRLGTLSQNGSVSTYSYVPNSFLVQQVASSQGALALTTTRSYDALKRLRSIASVASGAGAVPMPASYVYDYNAANQRRKVTLADNSYWDYLYDDLGQVTSGKRKWQHGSFVAGQQYEYTFDEIGNRTQTKVGGDSGGGSLRSANYYPDRLNQYDSRAVPGAVDVLGLASPASTVTVNGNTASRNGEYFHHALSTPNNGTPWSGTVTVNSSNPSDSKSGSMYVRPNSETFVHDADGNLTQDAQWDYTWDAENRLVKMVSRSGAPAKTLRFDYDWQGRRIRKRAWNTVDETGTVTESKFLYDGWNLIAELDGVNAVRRTYVWGTDLSGTMQGAGLPAKASATAGGVGGLVKVNDTANGSHFCAYDGNGNLTALIKATDGSVTASYEYGPFGEVIRATGLMAKANPFRFSTKYQDDETDLLYYGYRYYSASMGRWISRDPISEKGGLNLYSFVKNAPVTYYDRLGLTIPGQSPAAYPPYGWPAAYPTPAQYGCDCCTSARIRDGADELKRRYELAKAHIDEQGIVPDADMKKPNSLSCWESADAIARFMSEGGTPACWICFVEERTPWVPWNYSHNAIKCVTTKQYNQQVMVFDWFRGRPAGEPPGNFDISFPSFPGGPTKTYPDQSEAKPYNDCNSKPKPWIPNYAELDNNIRKAQDASKQ